MANFIIVCIKSKVDKLLELIVLAIIIGGWGIKYYLVIFSDL